MEEKEKIYQINVDDILPNRFQPRLAFNEDELNSLSSSIKKYGVLQPIIVRKIGEKYEIVAGERRYKATVLAGLKTIPAIINDADDNTSAEIALLENLQRKNLTVIEEAKSFKKLLEKGFTQEEIATKLGISQSSIANKIRLLNLPKKVQDALLFNKISERHARSLLGIEDTEKQEGLLDRIINEKLTVKQTEDEINRIFKKSNEDDIPDTIKKYLLNDLVTNDYGKYEYKDNKFVKNIPAVVNIIDDEDMTNTFQEENKLKIVESNFLDKLRQTINNETVNNKFVFENEKNNKELYKEQYSTISDIKQYLKSYNNENVKIEEYDLPEVYKIVIEIKKDANK